MKWRCGTSGWWIALLCLLTLFAAPICGLADGKVFARPKAGAVSLNTPEQRALLSFSNGVERLVIETSFEGEGTNFAWVVPLPSEPVIEAVSTNFFRNVAGSFQPHFHYKPMHWWVLMLVVTGMIAALRWARRTGKSVAGCVAVCFLLVALALIAIPNFVKSRGGSTVAPTGGVEILQRETVGAYETVVIAGRTGQAAFDWLNANGFSAPSGAVAVMDDYAKKGWVFAGALLNRGEEGTARSSPHPLAFTFKSEEPVYPLRLTAVGNGVCDFELYVFGPSRAVTRQWRAEYCDLASFSVASDLTKQPHLFGYPHPGAAPFLHSEIQKFAGKQQVVTKLTSRLTPQQMENDAVIGWERFTKIVPSVYTRRAAGVMALNWAVGLALFGLVLTEAFEGRLPRKMFPLIATSVTGVGVVTGIGLYMSRTIVEAEMLKINVNGAINNFRQFDGALEQFALQRQDESAARPRTFEEFKSHMDDYIVRGLINTFTYEPASNSASPGNVTLNVSSNRTEVYWHDINGNAHRVAVFGDYNASE